MEKKDSLLGDLRSSEEAVAKQQKERNEEGAKLMLEDFVSKCEDKSRQIADIMAQQGWRGILAGLVTEHIKEIADGNLVTPEYRPSKGAEQDVLIYRFTHWEKLEQQQFYDFVNEAMAKMGISDGVIHDPGFVKKVYEHVALSVAHTFKGKMMINEVVINLLNGTLHFSPDGTAILSPHHREDNFTYVLPYVYDPMAQCERFQQFLDEVLPEKEAQNLLAEYVASCLTRNIKIEKMLVLKGSGSNGKSVLMDILECFFGRENVSNVSLADVTNDDKKRAMIEHKLANISYESGREVEASVLKQLVSNEPVGAYINYVGPFTMYDYARFITSFNVMMMAENTYAFHRRIILLPFNVTITEDKADKNLAKKIIDSELPGILNWVIEGMKRFLVNNSFTVSPLAEDALRRYRLQSDNVRLFLSDVCEISEEYPTSGVKLYEAYKRYCLDDQMKPLSRIKFYDRLETCVGSPFLAGRVKMFNVKLDSDNGTF